MLHTYCIEFQIKVIKVGGKHPKSIEETWFNQYYNIRTIARMGCYGKI